ncbi:MAG: sterol carrier family protein [Actinomycetes bacterium]
MRDPVLLQEVKGILAQLSALAPGHAVEVRIPPYSAVQCVAGPKHTRGTPPNVVEMDYQTLKALLGNNLEWHDAVSSGAIHASGERSDLSALFAQLALTIRITS